MSIPLRRSNGFTVRRVCRFSVPAYNYQRSIMILKSLSDEGGIRTHGPFQASGFQDRCTRPAMRPHHIYYIYIITSIFIFVNSFYIEFLMFYQCSWRESNSQYSVRSRVVFPLAYKSKINHLFYVIVILFFVN